MRHSFISGVGDEAPKPETVQNNLSLFRPVPQNCHFFTDVASRDHSKNAHETQWATRLGNIQDSEAAKFTLVISENAAHDLKTHCDLTQMFPGRRTHCCCSNFSMSCQPHPWALNCADSTSDSWVREECQVTHTPLNSHSQTKQSLPLVSPSFWQVQRVYYISLPSYLLHLRSGPSMSVSSSQTSYKLFLEALKSFSLM